MRFWVSHKTVTCTPSSHETIITTRAVGTSARAFSGDSPLAIASVAAAGSNPKHLAYCYDLAAGGAITATDYLLAVVELSSPPTPDGNTINVTFPAGGIWEFGPDPTDPA